MNRRGFLAGILAAGVAPYVSTMAGVLMPGRSIVTVPSYLTDPDSWFIRSDLSEKTLEDMIIEISQQTDERGLLVNRPMSLFSGDIVRKIKGSDGHAWIRADKNDLRADSEWGVFVGTKVGKNTRVPAIVAEDFEVITSTQAAGLTWSVQS